MTLDSCEAVAFPNRMVCPRCDRSWAGDVWTQERPDCAPAAVPPVGLAEMIAVARFAADEVIASQVAAIEAGFREHPYPPAMRRAAVLAAIATLLKRLKVPADHG